MPSRYHCTVKKAFDKFETVGGEAILSKNGFDLMQSRKPGFVELRFEETEDGKRVGPDGKPYVEGKPFVEPKAGALKP